MKGFLHIVEILIVSMMVFLVLMQFTSVPKQTIDWQTMKLSTQANDLLFSLDRKGIDWFNSSQVNGSLYPIVSSNTIYSLKIRNSIKPSISVGCICSIAEAAAVSSNLSYFDVNGHGTTFAVTQLNSVTFSHDYDVIVVNQTSSLDGYDSQARQFLSADKGIIELRHFQQNEVTAIQHSIFDLDWNSSAQPPDASPVLFASNDSSGPYYNIYKYFHSLPVYQENFTTNPAANGWTSPTGPADWSWVSSNGYYTGVNSTGGMSVAINSASLPSNYVTRASFKIDSSQANRNAKVVAYWKDAKNYVTVNFNANAPQVAVWENFTGTTYVSAVLNPYPIDLDKWYDVEVIPQADNTLNVYLNGSLVPFAAPLPLHNPLNGQPGFAVSGKAYFDNLRVGFQDNHSFSILPLAQDKLVPSDHNSQKVIALQKSTQLPACIVNDNLMDNKGRTAWLGYNFTDLSSQDAKSMLRSVVIWAAGDENTVVSNDIKNVPVVTSIYKIYDQDMYQPVEVVLSMGNLYG